jgi:exodeoxyribonuclease VII large subunit
MVTLTVRELNHYLRELLSSDDVLRDIWVEGEVSNFKQAASGHCYFSLKDGNTVIKAVMWRSHATKLATLPVVGDAVLVHGSVSLYEAGGDLQLYADTLRAAGAGILYARFEELKARLAEEGLFDESQKRPLPDLPRRIGVATSAQGAALRDILTVLNRRCPLVEVFLAPCLVQGEQAPADIVRALHELYATDIDVIILARGGGSIEDLWAFNDEMVARTLFDSPVPVICGVGHETDTTIADYVADVRAPTPSVAAELAVPELDSLAQELAMLWQQANAAIVIHLDSYGYHLDRAAAIVAQHEPQARISSSRQQVDELLRRAAVQIGYQVKIRRTHLDGFLARLDVLAPHATLQRGYAIIRRADDGTPVTARSQVAPGDMLVITLHDGDVQVEVSPPNRA